MSKKEISTLFSFEYGFHPFQFYNSYIQQINTNFDLALGDYEILHVHLQIFQISVPQIFDEILVPFGMLNLESYFPCKSERYRNAFKDVVLPLIYGVRDLKVHDIIPTLHILSQLKMDQHVTYVIKNLNRFSSKLVIQMLKDTLPETEIMKTSDLIREWVLKITLQKLHSLNAVDIVHSIHNPEILLRIMNEGSEILTPRFRSDIVVGWFRVHERMIRKNPNLYWKFSKDLPYNLNIQWSTVRDALFVVLLAQFVGDDQVVNNSISFVSRRVNLLRPAQILNLPVDIFLKLIESNELFVEHEDVVLQLVTAYISENIDKKNLSEKSIESLISTIRVMYLSDEASVSFFNYSLISKELLQNRITEYTLYKQGRNLPDFPASRNCICFEFHQDFEGDLNGIIYYLGLDANRDTTWKNPCIDRGLIHIFGPESSSSISIESKPISREPLANIFERPDLHQEPIMCRFTGLQSEDCIFALEFDQKYTIKPTMYSIYFNSSNDEKEGQLGGWILEACVDPQESNIWIPLRRHETPIAKNFVGWKSWSLPQTKQTNTDLFYRYFRIRFINSTESINVDLLTDSSDGEKDEDDDDEPFIQEFPVDSYLINQIQFNNENSLNGTTFVKNEQSHQIHNQSNPQTYKDLSNQSPNNLQSSNSQKSNSFNPFLSQLSNSNLSTTQLENQENFQNKSQEPNLLINEESLDENDITFLEKDNHSNGRESTTAQFPQSTQSVTTRQSIQSNFSNYSQNIDKHNVSSFLLNESSLVSNERDKSITGSTLHITQSIPNVFRLSSIEIYGVLKYKDKSLIINSNDI